ncbi:MAG: RNA 2',3'-cyclic phosphodiesterase [Nevskiales bacterium]
MTAAPNRLFFALWPDDTTRMRVHQAASALQEQHRPGGYLIRPQRYHITLIFLGDFVPPEQEAAALTAASAVNGQPFALTLDRAGGFRNRKVPCWLGPERPPAALELLYRNLHSALVDARIKPERLRFVPHLTIIREAKHTLPSTAIKPIDWPIHEFVLIRSVLQRQPPEYEILGRYPLDPSAAAPCAVPEQLPLLPELPQTS